MIFPLLDIPWWGHVLVALVLTHLTIISVTVFLHRHQAHCALDLHPALSHLFRFWVWFTTSIITKQWVAVHRKHHANVESDEDPHSPQVHGIHSVLWGGAILYHREAKIKDTLEKYGKGTPDDWLERKLYARFPDLGIASLLVAHIVLFGWIPGIAIWLVQMAWIPFWAAGVINGVGHYLGYRNYELPDASRNIVPWGILIGGEELHNNHHAYASSAKFSSKPWEIDLGWLYIRLLNKLKLVSIRRQIPVLSYETEKQSCDIETAKVFFANRFQVVSNYAKEVMKDVYQEELRVASGDYKKRIKRMRRLLVTERSRLSRANQERLQRLLVTNSRLQKVYHMKESLLNIGNRSSVSYDKLRHALEEWCVAAETSGIEALSRFSTRLRGCVANY